MVLFKDFVFNLPENEFKNLDEAISMRKNFEKYGATDFEELAIKLKREPICPKCGSKNVDYATRVIGYLKRISNFSQARQEEASRRFYTHA